MICNNQYDEFLFFNCTKNSIHLKIMIPGLRGPAGSPYKSGDITGWGLKRQYITVQMAKWRRQLWVMKTIQHRMICPTMTTGNRLIDAYAFKLYAVNINPRPLRPKDLVSCCHYLCLSITCFLPVRLPVRLLDSVILVNTIAQSFYWINQTHRGVLKWHFIWMVLHMGHIDLNHQAL